MSKKRTRPTPLMSRPIVWIGLAVVAVIAIAAFGLNGAAPDGSLPSEISVQQAHDLYGQEGVFFLDVRQPDEWNAFHAPDSTLIPLDQLPSRLDEVPRDQTIVVVCRSGNRSQSGRDILLQAGFENVTSMAGGLTTWQARGYETVSGP